MQKNLRVRGSEKQNFCENPCRLALIFSTPDGVFAQQRAGMRLSTLDNDTVHKSDPLTVSTAALPIPIKLYRGIIMVNPH